MILTLLRATRYDYLKKYSFQAIVPIALLKIDNTVRYGGKVTITTPAGTFRCDKIYLISPQNKCNLFYEQNDQRRLVRYQVEKSRIAIVLLKTTQ